MSGGGPFDLSDPSVPVDLFVLFVFADRELVLSSEKVTDFVEALLVVGNEVAVAAQVGACVVPAVARRPGFEACDSRVVGGDTLMGSPSTSWANMVVRR